MRRATRNAAGEREILMVRWGKARGKVRGQRKACLSGGGSDQTLTAM
jgi:hypothetical protein